MQGRRMAPPGDGDEMAMMAALTRPTAARPVREEGLCGWKGEACGEGRKEERGGTS